MSDIDDIVKKPHTKSDFTTQRVKELARCMEDPMYFMRNFMKIQHPIRGAIPFEPYEFQEEMIRGFHENRFTVALTARQMGKTLVSTSIIHQNGKSVKIKSLIKLGFRAKIIEALEAWLIRLVIHNKSNPN